MDFVVFLRVNFFWVVNFLKIYDDGILMICIYVLYFFYVIVIFVLYCLLIVK